MEVSIIQNLFIFLAAIFLPCARLWQLAGNRYQYKPLCHRHEYDNLPTDSSHSQPSVHHGNHPSVSQGNQEPSPVVNNSSLGV